MTPSIGITMDHTKIQTFEYKITEMVSKRMKPGNRLYLVGLELG